jgi:hypothetical protein
MTGDLPALFLVDFEEVVPDSLDERTATVTFREVRPARYGVLGEMAPRVWLASGPLLAAQRDDIPGSGPVAAILRTAPALT